MRQDVIDEKLQLEAIEGYLRLLEAAAKKQTLNNNNLGSSCGGGGPPTAQAQRTTC